MTDIPDSFESFEDMGDENPFIGLPGFDTYSDIDPYERVEREVLDSLGIDSFDKIILDVSERNVENERGNRFESLREAVLYLFDAGILQFSGIVLGAEEIEIEVESDTGRGKSR